ncbi:MAG: hypothetical protein HOD92_04630 [Deltaproteobacteria bacterium]|nr:hypothetical protein [Deltaproteobacteria bacterium]
MALKFIRSQKEKKSQASSAPKTPTGLEALFKNQITLNEESLNSLKSGLEHGLDHFNRFNENRLQLAFKSFDESMKIALYEIIYLLHVNEPFLENISFKTKKNENYKEIEIKHDFNLYLKDAPCGVAGIDTLPDLFKDQFEDHILKVFDQKNIPKSTESPVTGIFSIGSIGTIGHKHLSSDLDLEILYRLTAFKVDTSGWNDQVFTNALQEEMNYFIQIIKKQQGIATDRRVNPELKNKLKRVALEKTNKKYPYLYAHLLSKKHNYLEEINQGTNIKVRNLIIDEIVDLMTRRAQFPADQLKTQDILFRNRIDKIQDYIETRYPEAEIYLFPLSEIDMKRGYFSSTLTSKESSGSAYEKVMTFDTLMPGVFYTNTIPAHFILPPEVNNDTRYEKTLGYIRFNLLDSIYADIKDKLMDQGPTSDMSTQYVGQHLGAVYWEAFKASSGNLPKALLNLFRFEMLFEKKIGLTVIQLVKDPTGIDHLAATKPENDDSAENREFLPSWGIIEIEKKYPKLHFDPWWMRYKALKIAYGTKSNVSGISPEEQQQISGILDLAFALHVRISDIFTKPGSTRNFDLHREKVLLEIFKSAFPPGSPRRKMIEQIFIGEVSAVNQFELEMRKLFKRSVVRVRKKVKQLGIEDAINQKKEYQIWYHFYEKNFELKSDEIHQSILNHLKVPRGRVQIGHIIDRGWFFRSLQATESIGKRFDTFNILDQLPPKIDLIEGVPFLYGLAHCIFNGYYGILNKGTLKEKQTSLEFDGKHMNLGNKIDNTLAFVHPGQVESMMSRIVEFFPYKKVDHRECLKEGTKVTELFLFLNLIQFGKISFLFRNNLGTVYCVEKEHPDLAKIAGSLLKNYRKMYQSPSIQKTIRDMFIAYGINIETIKLGVWVNSNSFETSHSAMSVNQKTQDLESDFAKQIKLIKVDVQDIEQAQSQQTNLLVIKKEKESLLNEHIKILPTQLHPKQRQNLHSVLTKIIAIDGEQVLNESKHLGALVTNLEH